MFRFFPSRGPHGSIYQTSDGVTYVRTPFGTRKLDPAVGPSLYSLQLMFIRATTMRRLVHAACLVVGFIIGAIIL